MPTNTNQIELNCYLKFFQNLFLLFIEFFIFILFKAIFFLVLSPVPFIKNKYFDEIIRVEGRNKGRHRLSPKLAILFNKATAKVLRLKDSRFSAEDAESF